MHCLALLLLKSSNLVNTCANTEPVCCPKPINPLHRKVKHHSISSQRSAGLVKEPWASDTKSLPTNQAETSCVPKVAFADGHAATGTDGTGILNLVTAKHQQVVCLRTGL